MLSGQYPRKSDVDFKLSTAKQALNNALVRILIEMSIEVDPRHRVHAEWLDLYGQERREGRVPVRGAPPQSDFLGRIDVLMPEIVGTTTQHRRLQISQFHPSLGLREVRVRRLGWLGWLVVREMYFLGKD